MEGEFEKLRRANGELQAWIRDLLAENETLRRQLAREPDDQGCSYAPRSACGSPAG